MEIEDSVLDQSHQCSTVCRQIVFALGGLAWAFIYGNKDNHVFYPVLTLIFVVLYMAVDICQYMYYYLAIRPLVMQLNKADFHPDYTKTERDKNTEHGTPYFSFEGDAATYYNNYYRVLYFKHGVIRNGT